MIVSFFAVEKYQDKCKPKEYTFLKDSNVTGKLYERSWFALMALRGCRLDMEDMWIGFNMSDFNKFDDVIMYCKKKDASEIIYCAQVKMKTGHLRKQHFLGTSGDFCLSSYEESYERVKKNLKKFMGREVDFKCGFVTSMSANADRPGSFLLPSDDHLFYSCANSRTFCLNVDEITKNCGGQAGQVMNQEYLFSVFVCTDQASAPQMEIAVQQELQALLRTQFHSFDASGIDLSGITGSYLSFIGKWVQGELGDFSTLTKTVILFKLVELMMEKYKMNLVGMPALVDVKRVAPIYTWNFLTNGMRFITLKATEHNLKFISDLILYKISKVYAETLNQTWTDQIDNESFYATFSQGIVKSEMLTCVGKSRNIYMEDLHKVLWKIGRIPLVVKVDGIEDYRNLLAILRLIHFAVDVIFLSTLPPSELPIFEKTPVISKSMFDLDSTARNIAFKLNISLQGKGSLKAQDIIDTTDPSVLQQISLDDLIDLVYGNFNVGNNLENLPDIHIRRTVPRVGLQPSVLKYNGESFLIRSTDDSLKSFLESNRYVVFDFLSENKVKSEDYISCTELDNFDEHCRNSPMDTTLHYLLLHDSKHLEWIKSRGGVQKIETFRKSLELKPIHVEDVTSHFTHSVNIISADPGAGKTILMRYLALMSTGYIWVIQIDLNKYMTYYDSAHFIEKTAEEHLRYFNRKILKATKSWSVLNELIFEHFLKRKNVLVLLDGFDEIAPIFTNEVTALALSLKNDGYPLWLTTRPVMRKHVETVFDTFALTLNLFNDEEQTVLLTGYFRAYVKPRYYREMKSVDNYVSAILMNCRRYFNDFDNKFMGIPLQIFLLGQVFAQSCSEYVTTGYMGALNFDLLDLYDKFTKMKINIAVEKFGHCVKLTQKNLHENHCLYALKVLFSKEDLVDFEDYLDKKIAVFMEDIKDAVDKTGIVVADVNVNFVHRSVSEYFAAKWLSENLSDSEFSHVARKLIVKIIDPNFNVIRNVFDRILAKKSSLLTAVINQDVTVVADFIKNHAKDVDSKGRNILCIAASWGEPHDLPDQGKYSETFYSVKRNSNASRIMALILKENIAYSSDSLLGFSPLDWAIKTNSLCAANQLLRNYYNETLYIEAFRANDYLYVCAKYNYANLAKKILEDWNSPFFLQIDAPVKGKTPLQLASELGNLHMVKLLMEYGANTTLKSKGGFTPLDYATGNTRTPINFALTSDELNEISPSTHMPLSTRRRMKRRNEVKDQRMVRLIHRNTRLEVLRQKKLDDENS